VALNELDIKTTRTVLEIFVVATGLVSTQTSTSVSLCQFSAPKNILPWFTALPLPASSFSNFHANANTLGIPLSIYQLKRSKLHPLVDAVCRHGSRGSMSRWMPSLTVCRHGSRGSQHNTLQEKHIFSSAKIISVALRKHR
jgi:hypothetical protein